MLTPIFLENDAIIRIRLTDADGTPVHSANVVASILRPDGMQVGDLIPMPHTFGGIYEGLIPDTLPAFDGESLNIKISANAGATVLTTWVNARATKRRVLPSWR